MKKRIRPSPVIKDKEEVGRLKKFKSKFDKLAYPEKLKFLEDNFYLPAYCTTYFLSGDENRINPENQLSVFPNTESEYNAYFDYCFSYFKKNEPLRFDIEKMKANYFQIIDESANPVIYTQTVLSTYTMLHNGFSEVQEVTNTPSVNAYMEGYNNVIYNPGKHIGIDVIKSFFKSDFFEFLLSGMIAAKFIPFLEEQSIILEEKRKKIIIEESEIIPKEIQQRIAWLYAIGVIDYLRLKYEIQSSSTIGRILSKGIGIPENTIKKTIMKIEKENLLEKYRDYIAESCNTLKIVRVK